MTTTGASTRTAKASERVFGTAGRRDWRATTNRFWRILSVELRTSPALLPVLVLTVIGIAQFASPDVRWAGYWQDMTLTVHKFASIAIGTVAGAIASWQVGRSRGAGMDAMENTGRVSGARIVLRAVAPVWVLAVAGFLFMLTAASLRSALVHSGTPAWGLVVMTAALLALQVAAGAALGAWLPRGAAPVVSIIVLYSCAAVPVFIRGGEHTWGRLFPILQQFWDPQMRENVPRLLVGSVWLFAASAVLVLVAGRRWIGVRPTRKSVAIATTLATASAALVLLPPQQFADLRGPGDPIACTTGPGPEYCAWADHADTLAPMAQAAATFARVTTGLTFAPKTVTELGVTRGLGRPARELGDFITPVPSQNEALGALVQATAPQPGPTCVTPDGFQMAGSEAALAIPAILSDRLGIPPELGAESSAYPALKRLSPSQQDTWMNAAAAAEVICQDPPPVFIP